MAQDISGVAFDGCTIGGEPVEVDLTEAVDKLCQLVDILVASDPDGDGIINVEGMIDVSLEGQCLTIDNCDGTVITVELSQDAIDNLTDALAGTCLQFKQCEGEVFDVTLTPSEEPQPVEIDCWIVAEPLEGCLDGECVTGVRFWQVFKSDTEPIALSDTLPEGADDTPCPCIAIVSAPTSCCDKRVALEGPGDFVIADELGLAFGNTIPLFSLTVHQLADKTAPATVTDCDGNLSPAYCGESITYSGGDGDDNSTIQNVTLAAGDSVVLEARVCPPREAQL